MYYCIDESAAKRAQEMNSFRDYVEGSETEEYNREVDKATKLAERQKNNVSEFYHDKIDRILDSYCRRLADWYNAYNRNRASCPSIMICGAGNFPVRKKEKQNKRDYALFGEYNEIEGMLDKMCSIGTGPVDLADPHAREILTERLEKLKKTQEEEKAINAYYRKHKTVIGCPAMTEKESEQFQISLNSLQDSCPFHTVPFPPYELSSIRGKIKRVEERLKQLDELESMGAENAYIDFDGGKIYKNAEINRLQIIFDAIPEEELRTTLKTHGFRWSRKNSAWQRQLTDNAIYDAKHILDIK